jgi:putative spermidine/putrescine transport system permease protein
MSRAWGWWALLAPGLVYLLVFFAYPLASALAGAFGVDDGPTLNYLARIGTSPTVWRATQATIYYAFASTAAALVTALPFALALRQPFRGAQLFLALFQVPLATPGVVGALMVLILFEQGGFIDRLLSPLGWHSLPIVRDRWGWGVIVALAWKQLPLMTLVLGDAFARIPAELREAARTLGSGPARTFLFVDLPLAAPGVTAAGLIAFVGSLGAFAIPEIVGPPTPTTLASLMLRDFAEGRMARVYALGLVLTGLTALVLIAYARLTRSERF